jgi:hypothetical protein
MGKNLLATKCMIGCQKRGFDVPNLGKRVFLKKVLPIWAHPGVVPFFKLAGVPMSLQNPM